MVLPVEAVAVIGRNSNPLAIKNFKSTSTDDELKYHFIANTMLDVVEERVADTKSGKQDPYLGLLSVLEDLAVVCTHFVLLSSLGT